jgi:hypothetical protein
VRRLIDRRVEERLVLHDPRALYATGGGQDDLRLGIVDPDGQFVRGEAAEDHAVDGAEAGAGQHGDHCLGDIVRGSEYQSTPAAASLQNPSGSSRLRRKTSS